MSHRLEKKTNHNSTRKIIKVTIYLIDLFPFVLMVETMNTNEIIKEEALIDAGFRKRYFFI